MCGRFTLRASPRAVAEEFALAEPLSLGPRFNIAPSQAVAAVRLAPDAQPPRREIVLMRWGLIPSWADDPAIGNRMINARAETAFDKPAFRAAMRRRRCLIPADGFYEWQHAGRRRQPYFFHLPDDRLFAFAGLWETWEGADHSALERVPRDSNGQNAFETVETRRHERQTSVRHALESCTILTTAANDLVRPIHDRMPVIVGQNDYDRWLDPRVETPEALAALLTPLAADVLQAYPVSAEVNRPTSDGPQCVARLADFGF